MRNLVLVVSLATACSEPGTRAGGSTEPRGDATATPATAAAAAPSSAPATPPRMLLGWVPTTASYRVIACGRGPEQRHACERQLAALVGTGVRSLDGSTVTVAKVGVHAATDGQAPTLELARPVGAVAAAGGATLARTEVTLDAAETTALRRMVRAISPRARWATTERFEVSVVAADLDGDRVDDTVAVGTIVDEGKTGERVVIGIAVRLAGKPFELVGMDADRVQLVGTSDVDGDGRAEVLIDRTRTPDASHYHYELAHVLAGKRLAMDPRTPGSISEAWVLYDMVEDHDRDDQP